MTPPNANPITRPTLSHNVCSPQCMHIRWVGISGQCSVAGCVVQTRQDTEALHAYSSAELAQQSTWLCASLHGSSSEHALIWHCPAAGFAFVYMKVLLVSTMAVVSRLRHCCGIASCSCSHRPLSLHCRMSVTERMPSGTWRGTLPHTSCLAGARSVCLCRPLSRAWNKHMLCVHRREFGIKRRPLRMDWARVRLSCQTCQCVHAAACLAANKL